MVGKGCVAIACDLRLGNQALTIACNFEKVRPASQALRAARSSADESPFPCFVRVSPYRSSQQQSAPTMAYQDSPRTPSLSVTSCVNE